MDPGEIGGNLTWLQPEDDSEAGDKKRPRRYGENGSVMAGETGKSWSNCVDLVDKNVEQALRRVDQEIQV